MMVMGTRLKITLYIIAIIALWNLALTIFTKHAKLLIGEQKLKLTTTQQPQLIFYNRIPKTGSTTFVNAIGYDLCLMNGFHVAHLNLTHNRFQMNKIDQSLLVQNLTEWHHLHPLFVHGHIAYVNFDSFGFPSPVWINIVREPFDRFLSHYCFLRYGDNFRVGLRRSKAGNNETFDECFRRGAKECDPTSIWLQIPYFCGTAHFCSEPGNQRAFELAKRNLVERYLIVGLTEKIDEMILLLEQLLPTFFRGAGDHFHSLSEKRRNLRHTNKKCRASDETERTFKEHPFYRMELEFYEFAKAEFNAMWARSSKKGDGGGREEDQFVRGQFHFEKIRP